MDNIIRFILVTLGSIFVALGVLGIFLPLLPTTPFLLLGATCYIRGSERLYNWLTTNRLLGKYINNYLNGKGILLKHKVLAISLLWITMGYSVIFMVTSLIVRILLIAIAVGVTLHIYTIRTLRE